MKLKNIILISAASLLWSCVNDSKNENVDTYDVKKILVNAADNIILPQLLALKESTVEIQNALNDFNTNPDLSELTSLREKFKTGYLTWQSCSFINFGSNDFDVLAYSLSTFPVNKESIDSFSTKEDPNLKWSTYLDARGYPGFDYVLYDGEDNEIINKLNSTLKTYCSKNIEFIRTKTDYAHNFWKNNVEGYYTEFKSDGSKTVTSAFSQYINAFCKDLEVLKNEQLKAPGGQEAYTFPLPHESEALYSGYSLDLFKAHLENLERIYKGEDLSGNNGIGFDDYLKELGTKRNDEYLNDLILNTFSTIEEKANELNGSINDAAANQKSIVDELYANVKKLVGYTKTDMTYAFGVNISYEDPQDGD